MHDDYRIATPENVTFGYQIAGIASRFLAAFVDHLVIFTVWFVLVFAAIALQTGGQVAGLKLEWVAVILFAILLFMLSGYFILFELLWRGQSPGKRLVGLRVLHADGTPLTLVDSLVRNLVRWIDFLPVYYGAGLITMFFSREARRLGDYAAGTVVIRERREITLESLLGGGRTGRTGARRRYAAAPAQALTQDSLPEGALREGAPLDDRPREAVQPEAAPPELAPPELAPLESAPLESAPLTADLVDGGLAVERLTADEVDLVAEYLRRQAGLVNAREVARRIAHAIALRLGEAETEFTPSGAQAFLERVAAAGYSSSAGFPGGGRRA